MRPLILATVFSVFACVLGSKTAAQMLPPQIMTCDGTEPVNDKCPVPAGVPAGHDESSTCLPYETDRPCRHAIA